MAQTLENAFSRPVEGVIGVRGVSGQAEFRRQHDDFRLAQRAANQSTDGEHASEKSSSSFFQENPTARRKIFIRIGLYDDGNVVVGFPESGGIL
jgi:hypothetical protein